MADVLSQNEIDALLNALNSGDVDVVAEGAEGESRVRNYDFRTANRFSKEQMRTLHIIYETFGRLFSTYLSGTLRTMCQVEVVGVEELKYHEFINALPDPVVLAILSMPPLVGPTLIEISPDVIFPIISHLLGGVGSGGEANRSFTEIELVLLERVTRQFIGLLPESWEKVIAIDAMLDRIETSPQFAHIVALNETVAVITLNVNIDGTEGLINMCLPHLAIEPINKQLNTRMIFQSNSELHTREPVIGDIRSRLHYTPLVLSANFNSTTATVREILSLQVGDVIPLNHKLSQTLTVKVGHLAKFRASIGMKENRYAVKIAELIREEDLDHE